MPKATSKKKTASKVGGGGVGTRASKFNLKIVIPIVLVVAALGGFYIFQKSSAGSHNEFSGAGEMKKGDGLMYVVDSYGTVRHTSFLTIIGRNEVCARIWHIKAGKRALTFNARTNDPGNNVSWSGFYGSSTGSAGQKDEICAPLPESMKKHITSSYRPYTNNLQISGTPGFGVNAVYSK